MDSDGAVNVPHNPQVQEVYIRGDVLKEQPGLQVELWDVERVHMLCPNTLSVMLCAMLNTREGVVWVGVGRDGVVKGVRMNRHERDKTRQMLDRIGSTNINPKVGSR